MLTTSSPFSFILFGASGHLAKLKIYPALYVLALKKRVPKHYTIMGFSRSGLTDETFRELVEKSVREHIPEVNEEVLKDFVSHCHYYQGQYDSKQDYKGLHQRLSELEEKWPQTNEKNIRLAYFSVPPSVFAVVAENLCEGGVDNEDVAFRCIVEKPVGHNLKSFQTVKTELTDCFSEDEIYLLDHYLGKEAVRNVYYLRFANPTIERLLKNTLIHHVEITASESAGLEGRAGYFEHSGTFRDMFQSHLLMVASLLSMRLAETEQSFRKTLSDAMGQFYLPPASSLNDIVLQGQYGAGAMKNETVPGYLEEDGVAKSSRTNTYAALKLFNRISRYQGVPFYLRSGKRMSKKETRISIRFQEPHTVGEGAIPNRLDIILQGEAGMRFHLQTKMGGTNPKFRPLILEDPLVCMGDCLPEHALLLLEAVHGKKQWFLTFDEIHTSWRLIDPIQAHLDNPDTPLYTYEAGSNGPTEANNWIGQDGVEWYE